MIKSFKNEWLNFKKLSKSFKSLKKKIAIVGAGLAGLTAGYRLQNWGYNIQIFEAKPRFGGRVFTVRLNGQPIELGGENIKDGGKASNILNLIREMGLETFSFSKKMNPIFCTGNQKYDFKTLLSSEAFEPVQLKKEIERVVTKCQSLEQVIDLVVGKNEPLSALCKGIISAYEGAEPKKISSKSFHTFYHVLLGGLSEVHADQDLSAPEKEISIEKIKGGNYLLVESLVKKIKQKALLNYVLKKINKKKNGSCLLEFTNGEKREVDQVILAVPASILKDIEIDEELLNVQRKKVMSSVLYGSTSKIFIPTFNESNVDQFYFRSSFFYRFDPTINAFMIYFVDPHGNFSEQTIQSKFDHVLDSGFLDNRSVDQAVCYADEIPLKNYPCSVGYSWSNDPYTLGSYSSFGMEYESELDEQIDIHGETVRASFAPIQNTLFFAGEHTTVNKGIIGTMEAAVESGEKVARLLARKKREAQRVEV